MKIEWKNINCISKKQTKVNCSKIINSLTLINKLIPNVMKFNSFTNHFLNLYLTFYVSKRLLAFPHILGYSKGCWLNIKIRKFTFTCTQWLNIKCTPLLLLTIYYFLSTPERYRNELNTVELVEPLLENKYPIIISDIKLWFIPGDLKHVNKYFIVFENTKAVVIFRQTFIKLYEISFWGVGNSVKI